MSYNGSGVFNINTAGQPVVTGTVISSTAFNALTADLATGLTTALTKDGQTTPTANIPMGGFKITGIAAATTTGDALSYGRAATVSTLTNSALTSGRVPYASTAGLLVDSANLTFNGSAFSVTGTVGVSGIITSTVTSGQVLAAGSATTGGIYSNFANTGGTLQYGVDNSTGSYIYSGSSNYAGFIGTSAATPLVFATNAVVRATIDSSGKVGIGTSSPASKLTVESTGSSIELKQNSAGAATYYVMDNTIESGGKRWRFGYSGAAGIPCFSLYNQTDNVLSLVADASGNVGIGVTPSAWSVGKAVEAGFAGNAFWGNSSDECIVSQAAYYNSGWKYARSGAATHYSQLNGAHRWFNVAAGTIGNAITWTQAMTLDASGNLSYGSWGLVVQEFSTQMSIGTGDVGLCFVANSGQKRIIPRQPNSIGSASDNLIDLGDSGSRFRTIYAGTGTINTSDRNEKQDIQDLSEVEKRIAVKIKSLIKTFRFKDVIAEKGDIARIHTGVIAQEIRDAFTSEGLDAHRYALFCSDTWIDDETNTEITRLGIRYDELLSFVIAAL
jgi:hypothetical protein